MEDDQRRPENVKLRSREDELKDDSSDSSDAAADYRISERSKTMWGKICSGAHALALKRGEKLQTNLTKEHPSFIKQMERSHVVQEFLLDVPAEFCKFHLPAHNVEVILEDESGKGYTVKFIAGTEGIFENGWERFSGAHKLRESDVLVFHLIRPCYFKVYIIRAEDPTEVGSTNLTSFIVHANEGTKESTCEAADRNGFRLAPDPDSVQGSANRSSSLSSPNIEHVPDHPSAEELQSSNMEISPSLERAVDTVQEGDKRSSLLSNPNLEPGPDHPSAEEFHSSDMEISAISERATENVQGSDKMGSLLPSPLEPGQDHPNAEVFHSSDMEVSISECAAIDFEGHKHLENVKVQAINSSKKVSSHSRKKTDKQVANDNNQTCKRCRTKRATLDSEAHALALKKAEEIQTNLPNEHPSFMKQMKPSHVTKCFELTLPSEFCNVHLPKDDAEFTLEDESGESYMVNFRPRTLKRFHGGWIRFTDAHNLHEGDVLVFHLLRPCHFKVYIVRVNEPTVVGNAGLTSCNLHANEGMKKRKSRASDGKPRKLARSVDTTVQGSAERRSVVGSNPGLEPRWDRSSSDELRSSDAEDCQLSGCCADFEKFKIIVNDKNIDKELPRSTRLEYYKLCCSRKSYLHKHILKSVHREFAVGIITGTLKMADAIRGSKFSTSEEEFASWEKYLQGFQSFGMEVGFLLERLRRLATVGSEFRGREEVEKYMEVKNKRRQMREETRSYEMKLLELREAAKRVEDEMKTMKVNILKHKEAYQVEASAPW